MKPVNQRAYDAVSRYMTSVLEDESKDNTQARRDAFAMALSKHLGPDAAKRPPKQKMVAAAKAAKEPKVAKPPRLGKKEAATVAAQTAGEGTPWASLLRPATGEPNAQEPATMDA